MNWQAIGAVAGAGSGILGPIIGNIGAQRRDHDARNFAREQGATEWNRNLEAWNLQNQRDDSTWNRQNEYNMKLWNMQNEYNSPLAQMQRYKEAGLNPNLIYGQSNTGGSVATANLESGNIQGTRPGNYSPSPRQNIDPGAPLQAMLAFREKSAQIDNLNEQKKLLQEQAGLTLANKTSVLLDNLTKGTKNDLEIEGMRGKNRSTELGNAADQIKLDYAKPLAQTQLDALRASLEQVKVNTDLSLRQDQRAALQSNMGLKKAMAEMGLINQNTNNAQLDGLMKQMDLLIKQSGPEATQMLQRILGRMIYNGKQSFDNNFQFQWQWPKKYRWNKKGNYLESY